MRRKNRLQVLCQSAEGEPLPLLVQSDGKPGKIRYLRDSPFGYGGFFRNTLPRWVVNAVFQQEAARRSSRMRGELEEIHPGWAHPSEAEAVDFDFFLLFFLPAIESHWENHLASACGRSSRRATRCSRLPRCKTRIRVAGRKQSFPIDILAENYDAQAQAICRVVFL
jgi:hypothetical protein